MPPGEALVPAILGGLFLLLPIIAVLTSHQQRMAKILHQGNDGADSAKLAKLEQELRELRQAVYQQTLAIDSMSQRLGSPAPSRSTASGVSGPETQEFEQRLRGG